MQNFELGMKEDLARNYKGAIEFYSKSVDSEELILDAHINLIVILFLVCNDPGLSGFLMNKYAYTEEEVVRLCEYLNQVLQKSSILFDSSEVAFWRYYKENFFRGYSKDRIAVILKQSDSTLVPYFQLYIDDLAEKRDVSQYKNKVEQLKEELAKNHTIKNDYILSLIESAEKQERFDQE